MLRKRDLGTINPTELNDESRQILNTLIKSSPANTFFSHNKAYTLFLPKQHAHDAAYCELSLTHDILARKRKENRPGTRYEVIDPYHTIGSGGFGDILQSRGTLQYDKSNRLVFKRKARAVKDQIVKGRNAQERQQRVEGYQQEYQHTAMTTHMHVKPLTITFFKSRQNNEPAHYYMTMKVLPGRNLYDIINDMVAGKLNFSTDQHIRICIAILRAVKTQIHERNLIHRDLKPENIMIDLATDEANTLDFFTCKIIHDENSRPDAGGTLIFMPQENFFGQEDAANYTVKSDSYSLGKTLAEFLRAVPAANLEIEDMTNEEQIFTTLFDFAQRDTCYDFTQFPYGDLSNEHAANIKEMIMELTRAEPENRWSLDQALAVLALIQSERAQKSPALTC